MNTYTNEYYASLQPGCRRSAEAIVPIVMQIVRPNRVVDVGCGLGTWLAVFREHGVGDIFGVDGDYVDKEALDIPAECFTAHDLTKPLRLDRNFDLVVSLEVGEHLPEECANTYVDTLTSLGPIILFSAAIPLQGGENHVNEQWPDYWVSHFRDRGYIAIDALRKYVWQNPCVEYWYAQNVLLFVREEDLDCFPSLISLLQSTDRALFKVVHPSLYTYRIEERNQAVRDLRAELQWRIEEGNRIINERQSELLTKVSECDAVVDDLQRRVAYREKRIRELEVELHQRQLKDEIGVRDQRIRALQAEIHLLSSSGEILAKAAEREHLIRELQIQVANRDQYIRVLEAEIDSIHRSRLWPLLRLSGFFRQLLYQIVYSTRARPT